MIYKFIHLSVKIQEIFLAALDSPVVDLACRVGMQTWTASECWRFAGQELLCSDPRS